MRGCFAFRSDGLHLPRSEEATGICNQLQVRSLAYTTLDSLGDDMISEKRF